MRRATRYTFCTIAALFFLIGNNVYAQGVPQSQGVAEYIKIEGENIQNGSIISYVDGLYQLASIPYSTNIYGVMVQNPSVAISLIGRNGAHPVVTSGTTQVLVSTQNGEIEQGDYITSSDTPGVAMKATQAGFVIGVAQEAFTKDNGDQGVIPVTVDITFVSSPDPDIDLTPHSFAQQLQNILTVGLRAVSTEPNSALRYAAAAAVLIASIAFGFLIFGRAATNGVAAVGRNPLARKTIFVMVGFNILMTVVFALSGIGLAIAILAL